MTVDELRTTDQLWTGVESILPLLPVGRTLAYQNAREHGHLIPGVRVHRVGRHKWAVLVADLRRVLLDAPA